MSEQNSEQSLSINSSQMSSGTQIGQAGEDLHQNQYFVKGEIGKQLTSADVLELMVRLEAILMNSEFSEEHKERIAKHLEVAKVEVEETEPDKEYVAKSLQKVTNVLKDASETVDASKSLWETTKPIMKRLLPWLKVVPGFLGL